MSPHDLVVRAAQIKNTIRSLTTERAQLAPQAVNGALQGPAARARIADIDVERDGLFKQLETFEAALQSPEFKHATVLARLNAAFTRNEERLQTNLVNAIADRYRSLAHGDNYASSQVDLALLPQMIAAELTGEALVRADLEAATRTQGMISNDQLSEQADSKIARMQAELNCRQLHTAKLMSFTKLPGIPPELQAKIEKANQPQMLGPIGPQAIDGR